MQAGLGRSIPCDAELQELMRQIDIMVNNKKLEWEKKTQALEVRMAIRDQELANAQTKLDQKGQEVGLLKQKLDSLQKTKYEMAQNYDAQLQALKSQFAKLTQSYEKLQLHQLKQNKAYSKGICTEDQEAPCQLSSLSQKLEEFKAKSREWDKQETLYQNHLVSLDAQRKSLSEKCNLFQKQAQNCQGQIGCPKFTLGEDGTCSHCRTEHLGIQQGVFTEHTGRSELFMEKLQSTVSEIAESRNRLQEENLKLQQEVKMYQRKCQNIEARYTEVKNELQRRNDLVKMLELECQQLRKEVAKIETYKNNEDNQVKPQMTYAQCIKDLETKKAQILIVEQQQENQRKELHQIRDHLYREEQFHRSEVERMRTEISDLTEELHQKEITIATITEKAALLERQLQMKLEIKEKMLGKQQQTIDLSKKEHKTYLDSSDTPEQKNERLYSERVKSPKDTEIPLLVNSITYFGTNRANPGSIKRQGTEERSVQNEREWAGQGPTYENFRCYRSKIPVWHGQGNIGRIENSSGLPQRPSRDREPIADGRSPSPPEVHTAYYRNCFPEMLLNRFWAAEDSQMPSLGTPFPATATEKFLQEEEQRARDFEKVLNSHIEELKRQSEDTLKKYTSLKQSQHR
ncbi:hypothetical protein lerEdw1_005887 [Lerista edwardsae]|nr:hypothetical protein lerEdw1_005887 [Lerista edwardsae]